MKRAQPWLGTFVQIGIDACTGDTDAAFSTGFAAIARMHEAMSPQRPDSDLARFNAAPSGAAIVCDEWTLTVLAAARELGEASEGVFDVSLGSGGASAWSLDANRLRKHEKNVRLDLGGIAKGEAVDRACAALRNTGVTAGWVNAGGDLRVFGDRSIPIHARVHKEPARIRPLAKLRDGAIATSAFDPESYPLAQCRQVSVAAPQCRWADALTKIVGIAPEIGMRLLPRYDAHAWI